MDTEAQVLEIIKDMIAAGETRLSVKDITTWFADRHGGDYERKITSRWVGNLLRKRLRLMPQKSHGVFVLPLTEQPKLNRLYEKYGITTQGTIESQTRAESP
jgi:hypothetical protein